MDEKKFFQIALNLSDPPWHVTSIDFDQAEGRIGIHIDFHSGLRFLCPECSSGCPVHDTIQREWRILRHYVDEAKREQDISGLSVMGIDEFSVEKHHVYVTLFYDTKNSRVIHIRR